jgi:hypothetical protein
MQVQSASSKKPAPSCMREAKDLNIEIVHFLVTINLTAVQATHISSSLLISSMLE